MTSGNSAATFTTLWHGAGHWTDGQWEDDDLVRGHLEIELGRQILTIEDPVSTSSRHYHNSGGREERADQRVVSRFDLRRDKIMVGKFATLKRRNAIQSLTGHLVFTVHARVVDVLGRFLNMGVEPYNFVSALNCILAQRLVRVICEQCKHPVQAPRQLLDESGLDPKVYSDFVFYEGAGCLDCGGTGFRGRTAIHELLDLSDRIREMILERKPASEIKRVAHEEGMTFLRESALQKAFAGISTLKEINK
jgi:type IV pilus assembly protein PilB